MDPSQVAAESYEYAAFISYRHVEPDRAWAKWLHGALETYRVPGKLAREQGLPRRVGRVFRDEEELPASADLSSEIDRALAGSRFLIVICSPATPQSAWVNQEVLRFRQLGRHDRILAMLVEGEPGESFPQALVEIRRKVVDAAGQVGEEIESVEPLAADVRSSRQEPLRYLRRMARLRFLACLLGVKFDDLRRREQERQVRWLTLGGAVLAVLLAVVGWLALFAFSQRNEARAQRRDAQVQRDDASAQRDRVERQLALSALDRGIALAERGNAAAGLTWMAQAVALSGRAGDVESAARRGLAAWMHRLPCRQHVTELPVRLGEVAVSPDGRLLALSTAAALLHTIQESREEVRILDLHTGKDVASPLTLNRGIRCLAFSPDSLRLAVATSDGQVRLLTARGGQVAGRSIGHTDEVTSLAFSPDGKLLLTGSSDKSCRLWNALTGEAVESLDQGERVNLVLFSPDGSRFFAGTGGDCFLWDTAARKPIGKLPALAGNMIGAIFLRDGRGIWIQYGGPGYRGPSWGIAVLWDLTTMQKVAEINLGEPRPMLLGPDGSTLYVQTSDGLTRTWDAGTGQPRGLALVLPGAAADFSPDGKLVLTHDGNQARLAVLASGEDRGPRIRQPGAITAACIAPGWDHVVVAGQRHTVLQENGIRTGVDTGFVQVWRAPDVAPVPAVEEPAAWPRALRLDAAGRAVVCQGVPSSDPLALACGEPSRTSQTPSRLDLKAFSPSGTSMFLAPPRPSYGWAADYPLEKRFGHLLAIRGGQLVRRTIPVLPHSIAFTPDGRQVLVTADGHQAFPADPTEQLRYVPGRTLHRFDVETGQPVGAAIELPGRAGALAVSPDGRTIAAAYRRSEPAPPEPAPRAGDLPPPPRYDPPPPIPAPPGTDPPAPRQEKPAEPPMRDVYYVQLVDAASWRPSGTTAPVPAHVSHVVFAPDGRTFCAVTKNAVCLFRSADGSAVGAPVKHEGDIAAAAFSPDSAVLASADELAHVRLTRTGTGQPFGKGFQHAARPLPYPQNNPQPERYWIGVLGFGPGNRTVVTTAHPRRDNHEDPLARADTAILWNVQTGKQLGAFRHGAAVLSADVRRDGSMVVTGGADAAARIWTADGQARGTLLHPEGAAVQAVAFAANDPDVVLTGCSTRGRGQARLWHVPTTRAISPVLTFHDLFAARPGGSGGWTIPRPIPGSALDIRRQIETATGLTLDEGGGILADLTDEDWDKRLTEN